MGDFSWACTCGKGPGAWLGDRDAALQAGELHRCRAGRLRDVHYVRVVSREGVA